MNFSSLKIFIYSKLSVLFGKQNIKNIYIKKCINIYQLHKCIFIHIPKTGGTTISNQLYGKRAGHFVAGIIINAMGPKVFNEFFSFSVVRNPFHRTVSAFRFVKNKGGSQGAVHNKPVYSSSVFGTFESFVKEWLIQQNPDEVDILFRPQYKFIYDNEGKLLVDWVGRIEDFSLIQDKLYEQLGLAIKPKTINVTKGKSNNIIINDEIAKLIYNFYKRDFDLFGYSYDSFNSHL